ncbi:hypothetical protein [Spirosoma flavum]|uniref:Uncharacterized protein n=1 Tax=Spirosoma flavum TaxID=2048557 RepID=A0ABW6AJ90_9BACT
MMNFLLKKLAWVLDKKKDSKTQKEHETNQLMRGKYKASTK